MSKWRSRALLFALMVPLALAGWCRPAMAATATATAAASAAAGNTAQPAQTLPGKTLIVYDSLAFGTAKAGNVETLQRLLIAFGSSATAVSFDAYKQGALSDFDRVVTVRNVPDVETGGGSFWSDYGRFAGGRLHIGAEPPSRLRDDLRLETRTFPRETVRIAIGTLSEAAIAVDGLPAVAHASGTAYGSIASMDGTPLGPYAVRTGDEAYAPYFASGRIDELAMARLLRDWLGIGRDGSVYLLFSGISPYSDLEGLKTLAGRLYESGIPFAIGASPLFDNLDSLAAKRYISALKSVQAANGAVLIEAPDVHAIVAGADATLSTGLESFLNALAAEGVAPLGIAAPTYWDYDLRYREEALRLFDSAVWYPNGQTMYRERTDASLPLASDVYSLPGKLLRNLSLAGTAWPSLPMNTALAFPLPDNEPDREELVRWLGDSWIAFADYRAGRHEVRAGTFASQSKDGALLLNGRPVDLNDPEPDLDGLTAVRGPETKASLKKLFSVQDNILIVLIASALALFTAFLVVGYRFYTRKYIHNGGTKL